MNGNGFIPISRASTDTVAWNLGRCDCGALKDRRAKGCRRCTRVGAEKWCSGCESTKPISAFYKRRDRGYHTRCRSCANTYQRTRNAAGKRPVRNYKRAAARITIRRQDPIYRLTERLRAAVRVAVKSAGGRKSARTFALLGCSVVEFRAHIEARWLPGMSWENWGRTRACWQLDHARPIASFDLTDPKQQAACFHFTNYQPLWAIDNARKGATWNG